MSSASASSTSGDSARSSHTGTPLAAASSLTTRGGTSRTCSSSPSTDAVWIPTSCSSPASVSARGERTTTSLPARRSSSRGVERATISPRSRTSTRSATCAASDSSRPATRTAQPWRPSARSSSCCQRRPSPRRSAAASSTITTSGSPSSAAASASRRREPRPKSRARIPRLVLEADEREHLLDARGGQLAAGGREAQVVAGAASRVRARAEQHADVAGGRSSSA